MSNKKNDVGIVHCDDGLDNLIRSRSLTFSMERQKKLYCHNQNRLQNEHKCPTPINLDCNDDCDNDYDDDDGDDCDESLLSDMAYYTSLKDGDDKFGRHGDKLLWGRDHTAELQNNVCNKRNNNKKDNKSLHLQNNQLQSRPPSFKIFTTSLINENNKSKLLQFAPRWKFATKGFKLSKSSSSDKTLCPNKQNHNNKNYTVNQCNTLSTSSSSHASSLSSTKKKNPSHFPSVRTRSNRPASNLSNETATTSATELSRLNRTSYAIPGDRIGRSVDRVREKSKEMSLVIEKRLDLQDDDSKVGEESYYSSASFLESTSAATSSYKHILREAGEAERRDDDANNYGNEDRNYDSNLGNECREVCAPSMEKYTSSPPPSKQYHQSDEDDEGNRVSHSDIEYCDFSNNDMNRINVRSSNIITEQMDKSFDDSDDRQTIGTEEKEECGKLDEISGRREESSSDNCKDVSSPLLLPMKKCSPIDSEDEHPDIFYTNDKEIIGERTETFESQTYEIHTNGNKSIDSKCLKEREEDGDSIFSKILNHRVENTKLSDNRDFDESHDNDDDEYQRKQILSSFSQKTGAAAANEAFDRNDCLELSVSKKETNDLKQKRLFKLHATFDSRATEVIERSVTIQNSSEMNRSRNERNFHSDDRGSFYAEYGATEEEANAPKRKDIDSIVRIISPDNSSIMLQETRTDKNATFTVSKQLNLKSGENDLPRDLFSDSKNTEIPNEQLDLKHDTFEDLESPYQGGEENTSPVALSALGDTEIGDLHSTERGENRSTLSNRFADDTAQQDINSLIDFFSNGNNPSGRKKRVIPSNSNSKIKFSGSQLFHDAGSRNIGEERCDEKDVVSCTESNFREKNPGALKVSSFCYRKIHSIDFKEKFQPRLFQIRRIGKITRRFQVPVDIKSLNHGDSFVLDTWDKVYTWFGTDSSCFEKSKSAVLAHNLIMSRSGRSSAEIDVQEDNQDFWTHLGGKDKILEASCVTDDNIPQNQAVKMYILVAGEQSEVIVEEVQVNQSNLLTERVCLIVTDNTIYVWIGRASPKDQQKNSTNVAKKFAEEMKYEKTLDFIRVLEGREHLSEGFVQVLNTNIPW